MTNTDHEALMDHTDPALAGSGYDIEGYVVDLACLRRYPPAEYRERAQRHTTGCALMGHCVESGYALVDEGGQAHLLDSHATPLVVRRLGEGSAGHGVVLRAERRERDGEMVTIDVVELDRTTD